ncbi:hypothetical protein [Jeongeupia naejangsanensis]|uniref:Uncharacterized protein n=1 Tax=Jeongeupia naejangsanensis TaxID=613195 RepID=A0ABS2BLJ8_9NEIS|nr:hypothetical protein [Jeongeupia naejangsanensis]MBM3115958.1 hypothetical protein [Jeongeupia naejangsanensis]
MKTLFAVLLLAASTVQADDGWGTLFTSPAERSGALQRGQGPAGTGQRFDGEVRGRHGVTRWVDGQQRREAPDGLKPGQRRVDGRVREAYEPDPS